MSVDIKTMPELRVASVRHVGPYNLIGAAFQKLNQWAKDAGVLKPYPTMMGVYWDDPGMVPTEQLRSDAAIVVPDDFPAPDESTGVVLQTLASGDYAMFLHSLYDMAEFPAVWEEVMMKEFPQAGRACDGERPCLEIYYTCCQCHPLKKVVVDIAVPVK